MHEMNLDEERMVTYIVCFHSQQFVEKMLKAYLVFRGIEFPGTHDLKFLKELCTKQDKSLENFDLGNLSKYAVEIRYSEEFCTLSLEEAREGFDMARKVKNFVLEKM